MEPGQPRTVHAAARVSWLEIRDTAIMKADSKADAARISQAVEGERRGPAPWVVLVALLSLSFFMYASIMYKIIKFGP
jgi:hypothetical protein